MRKPRVQTETPSPYTIPQACRFHTRCPLAQDICREVGPPPIEIPSSRGGHLSECHVLPKEPAKAQELVP